MPTPSPDVAAQRWSRGMAGATEKIREGVSAVTESPTEKAAAASDRYLAGVQDSVSKWQNRLRAVSLGDWKSRTLDKVSRVGPGATAAQPRFRAFMAEFLPFVEETRRSLPPRGGFSENIQRMIVNAERLHEFRRR